MINIEDFYKKTEDRLVAAMLGSDVEELDMLLSDDLIFTNHLGYIMKKEDDINSHRSGVVKIEDVSVSDRRAIFEKDFAVVNVIMNIKGIFNNTPASGLFRFTRVWKRYGGDYKVIAAHSTLMAE